MYRSKLNARDRSGAIIAVAAIHAALLLALLNISGTIDITENQRDLELFDVSELAPLPEPDPPPPPPEQSRQERAPEEEGAAAPQNIRSEATPVVAPEPIVRLPVAPPVQVAETPGEGAALTQGAGDQPGEGTGAGGVGTGTGAGGSGAGQGGGGGGQAAGARLVRGITNRDYPREIQRRWPRGGAIFLRLRIQPDGRASQCDVMRSFGNSAADQWTCSLIMQRGVFRPAVNDRGEPIASWYGYIQRETGRFDR